MVQQYDTATTNLVSWLKYDILNTYQNVTKLFDSASLF